MENFWKQIRKDKKYITMLAPMEEVTDTVFRQIINYIGRPDVFFTEFTNVEGLQSVGSEQVGQRLKFISDEQPLVAQVWGITPKDYYNSAKKIVQMGFAGIDINMGCPVKKIIKKGACSALIKNPDLAKEIIEAVKEGVAGKIPVSVKTRIGFNQVDTENWCRFLLRECKPDVLTVHGRTVKELSLSPCHYDEIGKVVEMRDELGADTLIIANGDIASLAQADELVSQYGFDGVMVGRGVFHNPWIFNPGVDPNKISIQTKVNLMLRHTMLFEQTWGNHKNFATMKRFFKMYINGFDGAADFRNQLMQCKNYAEVETIALTFLAKND